MQKTINVPIEQVKPISDKLVAMGASFRLAHVENLHGFTVEDKPEILALFPAEPADVEEAIKMLPPNVATIEAEYNGSGDSGSFESCIALDASGKRVDIPDPLGDLFQDHFDSILEDTHAGWEINDGAQGTFRLDVKSGRITNEHSDNVIQTVDSTHVYDFKGNKIA